MGFEPTRRYKRLAVFKTAVIILSTTYPYWYKRQESNLHGLLRLILSQLRMPISPRLHMWPGAAPYCSWPLFSNYYSRLKKVYSTPASKNPSNDWLFLYPCTELYQICIGPILLIENLGKAIPLPSEFEMLAYHRSRSQAQYKYI